jgi:hypothetical protein
VERHMGNGIVAFFGIGDTLVSLQLDVRRRAIRDGLAGLTPAQPMLVSLLSHSAGSMLAPAIHEAC